MLRWIHLNDVPSRFKLYIKSIFSFLPYITQPTALDWELRFFVNQNKNDKQQFLTLDHISKINWNF